MNRKPFILATFGLVIVALCWIAISYFLKASVSITVKENESIVVYDANRTPTQEVWASNGAQQKTIKLSKGAYFVVGTSGNDYTKHYFSVGYSESKAIDLSYESSATRVLRADGKPSKAVHDNNGIISRLDQEGRLYINGELKLNGKILGSSMNKIALGAQNSLFTNGKHDSYLFDGSSPKRILSETVLSSDEGADPEKNIYSILDVAINPDTDEFCALTDEGRVLTISNDGQSVTEIGEAPGAGVITCRGKTIATGNTNFSDDGNGKSRSGDIHFFSTDSKENETITIKDMTSFVLINETSAVYISDDTIFFYTTGSKNADKIMTTNSGDTTTLVKAETDDSVFVIDDGQVWRLMIADKTAYRLAFSPNIKGATYGQFLPSAQSLYVTLNRGNSAGNYILANNPDLLTQYDKLDAALPKKTADYTIDFAYTGSQLRLDVVILAPIGSSGSTALYDLAKSQAVAYIDSLAINPSMVSVNFQ